MTAALAALWAFGLGPLLAVAGHWLVTEALARPAPVVVPSAPVLHRWLPAAPRPQIPAQLTPRLLWADHAPDWLTGPVGSVTARWPFEDRPAAAIAAERTAP